MSSSLAARRTTKSSQEAGSTTYSNDVDGKTQKRRFRSSKIIPYLFLLIPIGLFVYSITAPKERSQENMMEMSMDVPGIPEGTTAHDSSKDTSSSASDGSRKTLKQADLIESPNTVVTAYFKLKSKFDKSEYLKWMTNMLSIQDAMVVFTSNDEMVEIIQGLRQHALNRTVLIPMDLKDVPLVQKYSEDFWQGQLNKDPEKKIHRSYQLFWIWLSKSWFVTEAIRLNLFNSDVFMWSDIGCFRNPRYNFQQIIRRREVIPKTRIFQMAHHPTHTPMYVWWNDKYREKAFFYHSGSQMIGYKDTWLEFDRQVQITMEGFVARDMFIGEDQTVLQSTCLRVHTLCAYVPFDQVGDNHYFGLRWVLQKGGDFQYFYPPPDLPLEKSDVAPEDVEKQLKAIRQKTAKIKLNYRMA